MSEYYTAKQASILGIPRAPSFNEEAIFTAVRARGVYLGLRHSRRTERQLNDDGIALVTMGDSGLLNLKPEQNGLVATAPLAGCTGVAAYAELKDGGSLQFIAHYSEMDQEVRLTGEESPVVHQLRSFKHEVQKRGELEGSIEYLVTYPQSVHEDADYGHRNGFPRDWHYFDQIQNTASQLGSEAQVLYLPYDMYSDHTLAAGKSQDIIGIFWDGVNIDFHSIFSGPSVDSSVAR